MMFLGVLAVGVALIAWSIVSHTRPNLFSQIHLVFQNAHPNKDRVVNPQLSALIQRELATENITGLSVVVVPKAGEPEFHAWGYRTEDRDPVTPDTLFRMASVSKAFCTTAIGLLIDDFARGNNVTALPPGLSELTWVTPLKEVLPDDWALMDVWASERANLRDILSHVSGLPRHDDACGTLDTPRDLVARLRYLRPAFQLREQWLYGNIMYAVASHVIATYAGQSYASFVQERIFAPLGMTSSTFSPTKAAATGNLTQTWTKEGRRVPVAFSESTSFLIEGPGGVISNAVDMAKWIATWLNEGVYENQTIFPQSVYRNVSYVYSVSVDHPTYLQNAIVGYGLGWFRKSYRGHDVVYHSGAVPGLSTLVAFLPSDEIGVALFANGESKVDQLKLALNLVLDSALHLTSSSASASLRPPAPEVAVVAMSEPDVWNHTTLISLDAFAGTYTNPGYGTLTLCSPSDASSSSYCTQVLSDFAIVDGARHDGVHASGGDLVAAWPRVWASHVRMRRRYDIDWHGHGHGTTFDISFTSLYPEGYGIDTTPFETRSIGASIGVAVFNVDMSEGRVPRVVGFGVSGLVEAARVTERVRRGGDVRDWADVWFDRV